MAAPDITPVLKFMVEKGGSDLFFSTAAPININIEGEAMPVNAQIMKPGMVQEIAYSLMNETQTRQFEESMEANFALGVHDVGRFRVNVFRQRGEVSMVIRHIKNVIPSLESLGLPPILKDLVRRPRGLILIVGATGSGKSTTLASMIDHRNENETGHILTLEDPIEFIHNHKKSVVDQREIGIDTLSFDNGLKNAMRQAPNVILIGEIRDMDTMKHAVAYSETGHLCLATLHANNANQALDRIINFFPADRQSQVWMDLSLNQRAIVAQQLVPTPDGKGRRAVIEVLINTPLAADLIRKGEVHELKPLMKRSTELGMQTFDQSLYQLYSQGEITYEDALLHADSANDLRLLIKLGSESDAEHLGNLSQSLSLQSSDDEPGRRF